MSKKWKLAFKITAGIIFFLLGIFLLAIWYLGGPEREVKRNPVMNAIASKTNKWDHRVDLTPLPFVESISFSEAKIFLINSGFEQLDGTVHPTPWISNNDKDLRLFGEYVYEKHHGSFVCDKTYIVLLKFDAQDNLENAEGLIRSNGCL